MKYLNKLLSLVIIMSFFINTAYADTIKADTIKTDNSSYKEYINVLSALSIIPEYDMEDEILNGEITRIEIIDIIIRMLGMDESEPAIINTEAVVEENLFEKPSKVLETTQETSVSAGSFSDIPFDSAIYDKVDKVVKIGLFSGFEDGTFGPNEIATLNQIVKVIVCVLGFNIYANNKGGYPSGYISVANEKGILFKNLPSGNSGVQRKDAYKMIYNALTVDVLQSTSFGEQIDTQVIKGDNIMKLYLDVKKIKGVISANENTTLDGSEGLDENQVCINGVKYNTGDTDAKKFLGYNVTVYAKSDDESNLATILVMSEIESKNKVLTVNAADILNAEGVQTFSGYLKYKIEKGNDIRSNTINIPVSAKYVYNNVALLTAQDRDLEIKSGYINFIDNTNDGIYDIVSIFDKNVYVVNYVTADGVVYDKYDYQPISLDNEDIACKKTLIKNNKIITYKELIEWDVVEILISKDGKSIQGEVINKGIEGAITEKSDDAVIIGENEYKFGENIINNQVRGDSLKLQDSVTAYLDSAGYIAGLKKSASTDFQYGYFIKANQKNELSQDVGIQMIVNEKEKVGVFACAARTEFNYTSYKTDSLYEVLKNIKPQIMKFMLNDKNEIIKIYTATDRYLGQSIYDLDNFSLDYKSNGSAYNNFLYRFGEAYAAAPACVVFFPPSEADAYDITKYTVGYRSLMTTNVETYKDVELYDADSDRNVAAMVVRNAGAVTEVTGTTQPLAAVQKVVSSFDPETGDIVPKVTYCLAGCKFGEKLAENKDVADGGSWGVTKRMEDLTPGDIIQFETNADGKITALRVVFDASKLDKPDNEKYMHKNEKTPKGVDSQKNPVDIVVHSQEYVAFEKVRERSPNAIMIYGYNGKTNQKKITTFQLNTGGVNVMIYNKDSNIYTAGTLADICVDDEVFIRAEWQLLKQVIIYR